MKTNKLGVGLCEHHEDVLLQFVPDVAIGKVIAMMLLPMQMGCEETPVATVNLINEVKDNGGCMLCCSPASRVHRTLHEIRQAFFYALGCLQGGEAILAPQEEGETIILVGQDGRIEPHIKLGVVGYTERPYPPTGWWN